MSERADAMRRALEQPWPEQWLPEQPGDMIVGRLSRVSSSATRHHDNVWILILADLDTGVERAVWVLHEALRAKLKQEAPAIGEVLGIRFEGFGDRGAKGNPPAKYRVLVDRAAGTRIDWGAERPAFMDAPLDDGGAEAPGPGGAFEARSAAPPSSNGGHPLEEAAGVRERQAASSSGLDAPARVASGSRDGESEESSRDLDDGTRSFRCAECMAPWPHHEPDCPNEFGGM